MKSYLATILVLLAMLSSCKAVNALDAAAQEPAATEASAPVLDAPAGVQPAPATMSRAQAKRYYEAQLAAQQARVPAKQKNSNNVTNTYEQKISNVSVAHIVTVLFIVSVLAFYLGYVIGSKPLSKKLG